MIDNKKLKELIKLMVDNDLTEVDLQGGDGESVTLKRGGDAPVVQYAAPAVPAHAAAPVALADSGGEVAAAVDDGLVAIKSPMVGSFYKASSPDTAAFSKVGDSVGVDSVVCIIEAMKVFNEIKSEVSGTIEKIMVEDGQAVEYDQPLFMVKPS